MKKFTFFVAILFIALAGNITAQTDYGITIAGIKVTSDNCDNITGAKISGSVSYDNGTKTLTLDDATIDGHIVFEVEDITIALVGENSIEGGIGSVSGTKTINGTGSLKVDYIDCNYEQNTIIEDCTIEMDNTPYEGVWVIYGDYQNTTLTIKNANVSAQSLGVAIGDFADIKLIGCEIVEPVNAQIIDNEFDGEGVCKYICDAGGNIAKKVVIKKSATSYGITIAGVNVTSANCNSITGEGITGSVSYNDGTKTLTLDDATIEGGIGFNDEVEDITITLVGSNYVYSIGSVTNTKIINGDGRLSGVLSIACYEKNTIIEDCTVEVTNTAGWAMYSYGLTKLTIKNANLSVKGKDVAIGRFKDIELMCCEIVKPTNAQIIDNELDSYRISKYIYNEDGTIATEVVIEKTEGNCFYTYTEELTIAICDNETYTFAGKELSIADVYYDTIHIDDKTDSIYILTLTVNPTYDTTIYDTIQIEGAGEDYDVTNIDSLQTIYGCDSIVTSITHHHYTSGLEDIANENTISIYPNPARDKVTIKGKGEIVITNSLGQVVKEIKDNNTYRTFNIKDFEKGVYYIKVGNTTQKLVVE